MAIIKMRCSDHPAANGRKPSESEIGYTLSFPLENDMDYLELQIGMKGRKALKDMLEQEAQDFGDTK